VRTERRVADWQCNRCGHIEQVTVAVLRDEVGELSQGPDVPLAPLPNNWSHVTISWNQGVTLMQDLCSVCTEKIDGFMQRRYDVIEPAKDMIVPDEPGEPEPKPKRAPRKRAAKKAT
jgi:hypothetical protein